MNNPIGKLIFNLGEPLQAELFEDSFKGPTYKNKIDTFYQEVFRPFFKYDKSIFDRELTEDELKLLEYIKDRLHEHFFEE